MSDKDVWRLAHEFRDAFSDLIVAMIRGDSDFIECASRGVVDRFVQLIKEADDSDIEYEIEDIMEMILAFTSLLATHNRREAVELLSIVMGRFSNLIRDTGEKCHRNTYKH